MSKRSSLEEGKWVCVVIGTPKKGGKGLLIWHPPVAGSSSIFSANAGSRPLRTANLVKEAVEGAK